MTSNPPSDPEGSVPDSQEIRLHVKGDVFKVRKDVLCENSDYFRAMFSGNYAEKTKQDIFIEVVEKSSMNIIIRYMNSGLLDLSQVTLEKIKNLAICADYLQMTKFMKHIEYWLDLHLSVSNWVEIMSIAERASLTKMRILAASFGLLSFNEMKPEYIPNVERLYWYLSHPCLNTNSELDVFMFGYKWILGGTRSNTILISLILTCLDVKRLTIQDLKEISLILIDCKNILATEVVSCLKMLLLNKVEINMEYVKAYMKEIEKYSEFAYDEVSRVVKYSRKRTLMLTPVIPMWILGGSKNETEQYIYKFSVEKGFESWLQAGKKDLWGWSLVAWGPNKLVLVCGENGKGTGHFMKYVLVYDTLRTEWTQHEVQLPSRRHAGVTVTRDSLFIVGGVGGFRVIEDSAHIYDLKIRTFKKICKFPDAIQSPAICTHHSCVYASGHKNIYKYGATGDNWSIVLDTEMRVNRMISFKDHIYCSQNYFSNFYRFRPTLDSKLEMITQFKAPVAAFCNLGNQLVVFTSSACGQAEDLKVESYTGPCACPVGTCKPDEKGCGPKVLWSNDQPDFAFNDVAGACAVVTTNPPLTLEMNDYHSTFVRNYGTIEYKHPITNIDEEKSEQALASEDSVETTKLEGTDNAGF